MKTILPLAICLFVLSCNRDNQCKTLTRYAEYTVSGKVSVEGYTHKYTRASLDWNADSTVNVLLNYDTCSTIYSFSLDALAVNDTIWLTDTLVPQLAQMWSVDYDAVTPPYINSFCNDCYVWLVNVNDGVYDLDFHLLMTTHDPQSGNNFTIVSDLRLTKN